MITLPIPLPLIILGNDQTSRMAYWTLRSVLDKVPKKHLDGSANDYLDMQITDTIKALAETIALNWMERVKTPVVIFGPRDRGGDCMTMAKWIVCVRSGGFIDYDGFGELASENQVSDLQVSPSDITALKLPMPDWATHVIWYNR